VGAHFKVNERPGISVVTLLIPVDEKRKRRDERREKRKKEKVGKAKTCGKEQR